MTVIRVRVRVRVGVGVGVRVRVRVTAAGRTAPPSTRHPCVASRMSSRDIGEM